MDNEYRLAIDVGGTFTDVVLFDDESRSLTFTKTPSSPSDPSIGIIDGIRKISNLTNINSEKIDYFVHGTTFATNAFLERKGSKVALLTTAGFRDIIEIGRQKRVELYDFSQDKPYNFVPRRLRYGIKERINAKGEVISSVDEESVIKAVNEIKKMGIKSLAIVYLHSYINPVNEMKTAEIIQKLYPECEVSLSHKVAAEFREYERTITTVINAYLKPSTKRYLGNLTNKLKAANIKVPYITKSNGGIMSVDTASNSVIDTLLSGPAGGVVGASFLGKKIGLNNIITLDMGGTSTDVSLIQNGVPKMKTESALNGFPLKVPMVDMETIGAGGGTIGRIDDGGLLKVGPESAGAIPGPACYGYGGMLPTITDANLVLGKIDPNYFLGGEKTLDLHAAYKAFDNSFSESRLNRNEAAIGMIDIANNSMLEAVRLVSVRRGFNPKDFTLFAFGGAAPLHATEIAKELNIPRVVIPNASSVLSALGFLVAETKHDYAITHLTPLNKAFETEIMNNFKELENRGLEILEEESVPHENRLILFQADLRYEGQAFEITVRLDTTNLEEINADKLLKEFIKQYEQQYGQGEINEPVEIVTYRVSAIGITQDIQLKNVQKGETTPPRNAIKDKRNVYLPSVNDFKEVQVYYLNRLLANNQIYGPAIIDGVDTTISIDKGQMAAVDEIGNIIIFMEENFNVPK